MNRTEVGLVIVGVLVVVSIVVGIVFPLDDGAETEQALDHAEAELAQLDATLTEVRSALVRAEAALAEAPAPPQPIQREVGTWPCGDNILAEVAAPEYWGTELGALESALVIEAEGIFNLLDAAGQIVDGAVGLMHTWPRSV